MFIETFSITPIGSHLDKISNLTYFTYDILEPPYLHPLLNLKVWMDWNNRDK